MNKQGFSLLECQIYIFLMMFSFLLLSIFIVNFLPLLRTMPARAHTKIQCAIACQRIVHDLSLAPMSADHWKKRTAQQIIWQVDEDDVGWELHNKKLLRIKGRFNNEREKWYNPIKSVALEHVDTFFIEYIMQGTNVSAIKCTISSAQQCISTVIALRGKTLCSF